MSITTEIVTTSINKDLAEQLRKLFVNTFLQLSIYKDKEKLLHDAINEEIESFNKSTGSRQLVIAKDNSQIIGLIFMDLLEDGSLYLAQGAISKSYQRHGVAKEMLKTFLSLHFNITGAFVLTRENNVSAVELYDKKGFTRNLKIYEEHPFLKKKGYSYPPFLAFEISVPEIKRHFPKIGFKFGGNEKGSDVAQTNKQDFTPIKSNL